MQNNEIYINTPVFVARIQIALVGVMSLKKKLVVDFG